MLTRNGNGANAGFNAGALELAIDELKIKTLKVIPMIQLTNNIKINASHTIFFDFINDFDKNYILMSPKNHLNCQFLTPPPRGVGSITLSEEILFGKHQKAKYEITKITETEIVMTALFPLSLIGGKLIFKLDIDKNYFTLNEIIIMGFNDFLIGKLLDIFLNIYFKDKYSQLNDHSKEGLINIKNIIENNYKSAL